MEGEMDRGKWLRQFIKHVGSQRGAGRQLGVGRNTMNRWANSGEEPSGALLEAIDAYWEEHGTTFDEIADETAAEHMSASIGVSADADVPVDSDETVVSHEDRVDVQVDELDSDGVVEAEEMTAADGDLWARIDGATSADMLAKLLGVPVLAHLPLGDAREAARALMRGWRWGIDPAPPGCHGDIPYYLYTREDVDFADEGAKRLAFAPYDEMFETTMAAEEISYDVHPKERRNLYAFDTHKGREDMIGNRLSMFATEKPYPDDKWFFGSVGAVVKGEWYRSTAEVLAYRRSLLQRWVIFREYCRGIGIRPPWLLEVRNELLREEINILSPHYGLTMDESVRIPRLLSPAIRIGAHLNVREEETINNEAAIAEYFRRRRRRNKLLWLPSLPGRVVRRVIKEVRWARAEYSKPDESGWCRRLGETILPTLHEFNDASEDSRWVILLKWLYYRHEWRIGRGAPRVCGLEKWEMGMLPDSEAYRRYWRPHEYEADYEPPVKPEPHPKPSLVERVRGRIKDWLS